MARYLFFPDAVDAAVWGSASAYQLRRGEALAVLSTRDPLPYQRLRHWRSRLLAPLHNMALKDFQSRFGMKSFRSGGASAAGAANIPFEVWGSHNGGWQSRDDQLRYMEIGLQQALQVSTAVTTLPDVDPETLEDSSEEVSEPEE